MTIIGFERCKNGTRSLLVFDPSFSPVKQLADMATGSIPTTVKAEMADRLLRFYRRSDVQLKTYEEFEILMWVFIQRSSTWYRN
jgi:hypothetical protein